MASNYSIVTQYPGIDSIGGNYTEDVVFIGFTTVPHGTYMEIPVEQTGYTASVAQLAASSWANLVEEVWSHDWVVGVQWSQIVDASNLLQSIVIVTVSSTSGNSTANTNLNVNNLAADVYGSTLEDLHNELDTAENS
jgi:hypothetical protein